MAPKKPSDSSTADDPVYGQPSTSKDTPGQGEASGPGIGSVNGANDPAYSQTRTGISQINDPVYGQTSVASDTPGRPAATSNGVGSVNGANDPVYSQTRTGISQINDPVYGQSSVASDTPGRPAATSNGVGGANGADDPVYSQTRAGISKINDPVYGQSSVASDTPGQPQSGGKGVGGVDAANDPVASQSQSQYTAQSRLNQLSSQISPTQHEADRKSKSKRKKKQDATDLLPPDYSDILNHVHTLQKIAQTPDIQSRGYQRQKTSGKLWARERIAKLVDEGTWREIGSVTGTVEWEKDAVNGQREHVRAFTPSNNPQGFGRVTCLTSGQKRQIYLTSDDFSIRSGHADGSVGLKTLHGERLALRLKVPVVKLVDGSSGGGSVSTIMTNGYSYMPHVTILSTVVKQLNMGIPNIGAILGPAIGLGAARVVSTHFSVMAADVGSLFNAGPKVVEGATFEEGLSFADLGGPGVHCTNGTIDNLAVDEDDCFRQIRTVLGYLPDCGQFQAPPVVVDCADSVDREDIGLRSVIPRRKARSYNAYTIINSVVDQGSWFEIGRLWGRTGITGLARLGGRPVGILSLNCEVNSGALDALGSQKLMKMIKFCDVFNLPIVQFVDVPGYAIGTVAERSATMKWGVELAKAYYSTTTPIFSVITRRVYGVAGGVMLDSREPWMRIAWPSGNWGSLPLDGGIEVGHRHELKQIGEKEGPEGVKRRYKELEDEYIRLMNPVRTATVFNMEEIVDPKDTRKIVCRWAKEMYGVVMQERLADRAAGRIHAVFT